MNRSEGMMTALKDIFDVLPSDHNGERLKSLVIEAYERGAATKMKIAVDPNSPHSFVRQRNSQMCAVCDFLSGSPLHTTDPEIPMKVFMLRRTAVRVKGKYQGDVKPWFQIVDCLTGEKLSGTFFAAAAAWLDALLKLEAR